MKRKKLKAQAGPDYLIVESDSGYVRKIEWYNGKLLAMIEDKMAGVKLRRKAYVCNGGQVQHINDLGFGTVTDAFIARPQDCKYCVFETLDNKALLVDMFELTNSGNPLQLTVKEGTTHTFDSVDAAIMYALTIE